MIFLYRVCTFLLYPLLLIVVYYRKIIQKGLIVKFRIFANYVLTTLSNLLNNQNLTDAHTCYKLMKVEVIKKLNLSHEDFSICPEIIIVSPSS